MSKLNDDILFLLLEELQNDPKSLFSCMLVNRLWCKTVIPILWKNPWYYEYDINYKNKISLYYIITYYLSDDIKEFLKRQGIRLPPAQKLLFDYLSFCRSMNVNVINDIIVVGSSSSSAYNRFLLQQEIYRIFISKCPELKYLDIRSIEHQIFYFPKAESRLYSLCELTCDTSIDPSYFYGLARFCNNIEKLIITNTVFKANHGIINLVEFQKNLKYFEWEDDFGYFDEEYDDIYEETFLALAKKADTLIHFIACFQEGCDVTFPPEILSEFRNLKTLKINFNIIFDYDYDTQLNISAYPNLETLQLGNIIYIDTVTSIVENSGGCLKKILINNYHTVEDRSFYEDSKELIRKIYENCPFIEYLSLAFPSSEEHFFEFEKLLKACQKLKALLLCIINIYEVENSYDSYEKMLSNGERLSKALIRSAPISLREIRFFENFKFSLKTFEEFLKSWRGRPPLSILTSDRDYEKEQYTRMIKKYKDDDGVVITLRCLASEDIYFY